VYAVIRASRPRSEVDAKVHRAWLAMAGLGLIVIGVAALIAWRQTRVLTRPVTGLTGAAERLGDGDFATRAQHSGIAELDAAADALNVTAVRLGTLLQRERAFTADASHQLRTPLTALSIELDAALLGGDADLRPAINDALDTVDQIQITIDDLTALGRDVALPREPLDLHPVMLELERRWSGQLDRLGRSLVVRVEPDLAWPTISEAAVRQIMDVLVANAVEHGAGTVTVTARATGGGVALEVSDEGRGVEQPIEQVFRRRTDPNVGRGIGLALARSLAEAEGGRLLLESPGPAPTFRLLMPAAPDTEPAVT
jgi:signal transduction histidine kinase